MKTLNKKLILLGLCFVFALTSVGYTGAQSADEIVLNVSPTVIELDINRGASTSGSFRVVNGSEVELELTATAKNFTASDELGGVSITEDDTNFSVADWITVTPENIAIGPRQSQIFEYTISVPEDAEPGGHFGAIIVNNEPINIDNAGPSVVQEVGPLILVRVPGDIKETAQIVEFSSNQNLYDNGPVNLLTRIENTGNVHFKPKGRIEIKNMFGGVVTTINLEERNVLPGTIRQLSNSWNPDGFNLGRYTAELTVIYGESDEILTSKVSFILFPYKVILPIAIALVVVVVYVIRNKDRIRKALSVLKNG